LTSWVTISFPKKILPHGSSSSVSWRQMAVYER
jgi:hypothetical protein